MDNEIDDSIFREEPVDFIEMEFDDSLWGRQKQIAESVRDNLYTAVRSCHGAGKSHISARIALWFLHSFADSKVITTAPTFRQVEDILWREIRDARNKAKVELGGKLTNTKLEVSDNWFAVGLSTDDPDRFQGYHAPYIMVIIDEASGIQEPIFQAIEGIISAGYARVLYIGNPTGLTGTFYQSFRLPNVSKIHISAFDTPNFTKFGITLDDIRSGSWEKKINSELPRPYLITPSWVADKFNRWGENSPMWQSRVMGEFPVQGEDTLIPLAWIERAVNSDLAVLDNDPEAIGADIARFGVDKTEFCYRKGPKIIEFKEYSDMDTMTVANALRVFSDMHPNAQINIDEVGIGGGVVDRLKQMDGNRNWNGLNVGVPSEDPERFSNLRAQLYWSIRERFMNQLISIPNDDDLLAQLSNLRYKFTDRGQIQIESKDDMKKRGLPSPDKADAMVMSFFTSKANPSVLEYMKAYKSF